MLKKKKNMVAKLMWYWHKQTIENLELFHAQTSDLSFTKIPKQTLENGQTNRDHWDEWKCTCRRQDLDPHLSPSQNNSEWIERCFLSVLLHTTSYSELMILLPQHTNRWDYRCVSPCQALDQRP